MSYKKKVERKLAEFENLPVRAKEISRILNKKIGIALYDAPQLIATYAELHTNDQKHVSWFNNAPVEDVAEWICNLVTC